MLKYREEMFPGVPVVFGAVEEREVEARRLSPDVVGVPNAGWSVARSTLGNERVTIGGGMGGGFVERAGLFDLFTRYGDRVPAAAERIGHHGAEAAALRSREWSRLLTGRDPSGVYGIQMFGIRREQGRLVELAPVGPDAAHAMLRRLKGFPLLAGFRGSPTADLDAIADAICRVSELIADHRDRIAEIDVNPLICSPGGAVAVDALIVRSPPP